MPIILDKINKKYGNHIVLDNYDLEISDGEMVAITGESGIGKTTLLHLIGLLESPDSGRLRINEYDTPHPNSITATKLRRSCFGYLFQNYALIDNMSVYQNLLIATAYGDKRHKLQAIQEALNEVGLKELTLKQKIYELSGGEQQRVALARLLIKPCEIILADEPTGALDVKNGNRIIEILKKCNAQGKTIIIVTHDQMVASSCTKCLTLSNSAI